MRVRNRLSSPMQRFMEGDPRAIAVMVNQSGETVLFLAVVFRSEDAEGHRWTNHFSGPFFAGGHYDVLNGAAPVQPAHFRHIFPGSKRLITAQRVWGDNTDVIPPDANDARRRMAGSFAWTGGRAATFSRWSGRWRRARLLRHLLPGPGHKPTRRACTHSINLRRIDPSTFPVERWRAPDRVRERGASARN